MRRRMRFLTLTHPSHHPSPLQLPQHRVRFLVTSELHLSLPPPTLGDFAGYDSEELHQTNRRDDPCPSASL